MAGFSKTCLLTNIFGRTAYNAQQQSSFDKLMAKDSWTK
jgi:hypothetical protein